MKKIKFLIAITAIGFAVTLFSCSKGDTGATGPAGSNGANGLNGTNGTNGTNGKNGNANIKDSIFTVSSSSFGVASAYDYYTISDPQITAAINATGLVTVYWSPNGGTNWDLLPWSSENPVGYIFSCQYTVGSFTLYFSDNGTAANPSSVGVNTNTFKIVCATADGLNLHANSNDISSNVITTTKNGIK